MAKRQRKTKVWKRKKVKALEAAGHALRAAYYGGRLALIFFWED
ncbi:hypothetical protein [Streptomyces decoyicus]